MIEMSQAEVDNAIATADLVWGTGPGVFTPTAVDLARAVRHLHERDRQNTAIIELGVLAGVDAEERCAVKLAEAQAQIARLEARPGTAFEPSIINALRRMVGWAQCLEDEAMSLSEHKEAQADLEFAEDALAKWEAGEQPPQVGPS